MNQTALLHIVERLERLVEKLPEGIRRPILNELTPLKELFLQQRPPRFLFVGSGRLPLPQIIRALFLAGGDEQIRMAVTPIHRWAEWRIDDHGTVSVLDARAADESAWAEIRDQLQHHRPDIVFVIGEGGSTNGRGVEEMSEDAKLVGVTTGSGENVEQMRASLFNVRPEWRDHLLKVVQLGKTGSDEITRLMSVLTEELPNEAKLEMIRISRDRQAQHHIAQILIKSTTAICTAIGAQPIPLADLPILTTLQLVMVSGIMYISGRERSLRAATEFVGALGVNVGAGMLLREGARAILKFFPGWGNVVCGMVAGAGTYAIGRAATAYFLDGVSLKDARRTYLKSRKRRPRLTLPSPNRGAS